jgi:hypothetical protein
LKTRRIADDGAAAQMRRLVAQGVAEQGATDRDDRDHAAARVADDLYEIHRSDPGFTVGPPTRPSTPVWRNACERPSIRGRAARAGDGGRRSLPGALDVVAQPGYSRPLVRVADYVGLVEATTFRDDRVRRGSLS